MFLQTNKNIIHHFLDTVSEPSAVYFWVLIAILVLLFFFFLNRTKRVLEKENAEKEPALEPIVIQEIKSLDHEIHEEEAAAIAMALYLYKKEIDRKEHLKTTLQRVSRIYSPWNSKIYTLRQNPRR